MKILIVDDSQAMRNIVRRTLRQAGYGDHTVQEASNAKEACDLILGNEPDLVLCDWNMPSMTGIELLGIIRESGSQVKFIFVTSESSGPIRHQAATAGASYLVTKPFTPEDLHTAITRTIQ